MDRRNYYTFMIFQSVVRTEFPELGFLRDRWAYVQSWPRRCFGKGFAIGAITDSPNRGSALLGRRSNFWRPSPIKPSSPSRTSGCSRNSRNRWNSKRRRVKSWALLPARRPIFSPCWMWLRKMPRDSATLLMLRSSGLRGRDSESGYIWPVPVPEITEGTRQPR